MAKIKTSSKSIPINSKNILSRLNFFQDITKKIFEKKPLKNLLDEIIFASKQLLQAEASSLLLYDKGDKQLHFHTVTGEKGKAIKSQSIKLGEGISGWTAKNKKPIIIDNCYKDSRFNKEFDLKSGFRTRNMICVPMVRKKELIGVIQTMNKRGGETFTAEDLKLFEALAAQCAVAIDNARLIELEIKYELNTARNIQMKLIPQCIPSFDDLEINVKLVPAKEVGGDYFNVIKLNKNETLFMIADVTGKSVPAALIVSTVYSFLQTYLILSGNNFNLSQFVVSINKFLIASTGTDKFVTAWFGLYDHSKEIMHSINAGHNPIYFLKNNSDQLEKLTAGGLMLGSIDFPYSSEELSLSENDLIVFYTDGIPEAMNLRGEEFGENNFEDILLLNRNLNVSDFSDLVFSEIKNYRGKTEQSDDITLGILRIK
ncbi:MAG: GAF domain-containing SpoIIE family protein phosphatase [Melioribacteraceae bacterium]